LALLGFTGMTGNNTQKVKKLFSESQFSNTNLRKYIEGITRWCEDMKFILENQNISRVSAAPT
jgi:hypothetical protein